ncbi:protein Jade-1 [Pimephales promelas]|uniref:protein Jade-1 n=1 Tax=Pimephales promelas TaxID=90988 RepID=UPI001955DF67|nr:protein Jade-1 [Pimephales promelas]XP_039519498.1 protein Jade-1 [Pimephales promelas]XP_039519499.1 protein Jade-1 [Pimephales promelas]XP_039519500.1 protein Jade-1 [Pimephales promelas]KAG1930803.1 E3 ubiquitin-protein ligase Jade-2 [Pimephales promelas]KAG1930804.1 E3 ubiquitin-protein ligase Jade-2 [Pimephales promelas]
MESEMKRRKYSTSSNDSDTTDSHVTTWSRSSKNTGTSSTWVRHEQKKPSEVFRTDFITAMKLPDSAQLSPEEFYFLSDPWRQEWEKGVQVPASVEAIPLPVVRELPEVSRIPFFSPVQARGPSEFGFGESHGLGEPLSRYDLDELDVAWLELVNAEFRQLALPELDELTMEQVVLELESRCQQNMQRAIETEEGLGIEYDEDVVCDVCRSPEGEDSNEMVFCDKCNVCVHQACYGILKVPQGNWLCRTCALGVQAKCLLCPRRGGALKPTRSGTKWVHVSCALWIPEVSIGCPEKMEPITKVSHIPASRWALYCSLCREHTGTCIQCSMPSCAVAFHVTCAFDNGLEMRTTLAENDEVRFKSFCLEHSSVSRSTSGVSAEPRLDLPGMLSDRLKQEQVEREKASHRKQKLQELEDQFYTLVDPKDVAESLSLPDAHVDFLFQYWKLRRKANFNQPLVVLKKDEVDNLAQQEQDVLYRRLQLFTHLRQDLERVRNLCYMVTRRERIKHSLCNLQEKIFSLQIQLLEKDLVGEKNLRGEKNHRNGVRERAKERRKSSPEKKDKWKSDDASLFTQLGFSKSFPLDGSLFDSWLARSVHITADNMLSQWSLSAESDDPSASLLQGEENLLSLMMDQSTWKTPQLGRKARNSRRKSASLPRTGSTVKGKRGERSLHRHSRSEARPDPLQPAISKMDSCHISEEHGSWGGTGDADSQVALRLRLPRPGKSRSKSETSLLNSTSAPDTETDGYFSDAEQSDTEFRSSRRKLRLPQLHAGKEQVVRRSVLAS